MRVVDLMAAARTARGPMDLHHLRAVDLGHYGYSFDPAPVGPTLYPTDPGYVAPSYDPLPGNYWDPTPVGPTLYPTDPGYHAPSGGAPSVYSPPAPNATLTQGMQIGGSILRTIFSNLSSTNGSGSLGPTTLNAPQDNTLLYAGMGAAALIGVVLLFKVVGD